MTCLKCHHGSVKRFGTYGRRRIQRFRCHSCRATFSLPRTDRMGRHYLPLAKGAQVISLLTEGVSIRAAARISGVNRNTILSLLLTAGEKCRQVFDKHIRDVHPRFVQADELWCYVQCKEAHLPPDAPKEWGDAYTWVALESDSKLVLSYHVGKRDAASAYEFIGDLSQRVTGRFQITTDGFRNYIPAIEEHFGANVDFAQLVKLYGTSDGEASGWYQPSHVTATIPVHISGNPNTRRISTSHIERANLSVRMHLRRFTRLTNAFSKSLRHLRAAVSVYMAWYNFCRVHSTLRVTPAMEAKITDHVWTVEELLRS